MSNGTNRFFFESQMKNLVRGYFEEAKWFHQGYVPSMEEYMQVALLSSGYKMVTTTSFVGMGELATKEAFDWVSSFPLIVEAVSTITRLTDDIVGHKVRKMIQVNHKWDLETYFLCKKLT